MYVIHEPKISNVNYEYKFLPHMKKPSRFFPEMNDRNVVSGNIGYVSERLIDVNLRKCLKILFL